MAFRFPAAGVYTFDAYNDSDVAAFLWTDPIVTEQTVLPDGTPTAQLERQWNWCDIDTGSSNVGPEYGVGGDPDGFAYTEASSPAVQDDEFTIEHNDSGSPRVYDASANAITIEFRTNQRGDDNDAWCYVQTNENAAGWVTRATFGGPDDPNKVGTGVAQIWASRSVDLTGLISHASTRIRILVVLNGTTVWNCDYGIDEVAIIGVTALTTEQEGHQFRDDDGSESGASDRGAQDSNISEARATNMRLRVLTDTEGDAPAQAATLQYRKVGDGAAEWRNVPE